MVSKGSGSLPAILYLYQIITLTRTTPTQTRQQNKGDLMSAFTSPWEPRYPQQNGEKRGGNTTTGWCLLGLKSRVLLAPVVYMALKRVSATELLVAEAAVVLVWACGVL